MQVALYIRVSTPVQAEEGVSLDAQKKQLEAWAHSQGHIVITIYEEPGETATNDRRPQFQRMISDAISPERPFDAIIVYTFSRFYRDEFEFSFYERKLKKHKVRIISITQPTTDDPMGNMTRKFMTLFNQYSSEQNSIQVHKSMIQNAQDGFFNGAVPPFGYISFMTDLPSRGGKKRRLMINPDEAETVGLLYKFAHEGHAGKVLGLKKIATHLNAAVLLYRGKLWRIQAVHATLTNSVYHGEYIFNRRHAKTGEIHPESEWVKTSVPAIVTKEIFDAVATSLTDRSPKNLIYKGILTSTLLAGIAKCGLCGRNMILASGKGGNYDYYRCSTRTYIGNMECNCPNVPREELEQVVLNVLEEKLLTTERITATVEAMNERLKLLQAPDRQRELDLHRKAALTVEQLSKWFTAVEAGSIEIGASLNDHINALQRKRDTIASEIAQLQYRHRLPIRRFGRQQIEAFIAGIKETVLSAKSPLAKNFLRALVSEVKVTGATTSISGDNLSLATAISKWKKGSELSVPRLVSQWCSKWDSNRCIP